MDAARAADGGTGVLLLYRNYAGDVMNFNMATERLGAEAVEARTVLVNDDTASAPPDRKDERRGTAGGSSCSSMPIRQGGRVRRKSRTAVLLSFFLRTTAPAASTP